MSIFDYIALNYRWITIWFYLIPVSILFEICLFLKNWLMFKVHSSPSQHEIKIKSIQRQVQQWIRSGQKEQLRTTRSGSDLVPGRSCFKGSSYNIRMNLYDILEINSDRRIIKVQPFVTVRQLTSALLPLGWTIPVVPGGIDGLTVGDLILGSGLDSSSHKYGLFHNCCISYEMVLTDGSLVKCSKDENSDLFHAIPWSCGTLGFLTAIEIKLIPAHNYVRLEFKAFHNKIVTVQRFLRYCDKSIDFVEGLLYNENQCVVVTGEMVDQIEPNKLNEIGKWYKPWFFQHVKNYFIKGSGVEYIPLKDYYYRRTRLTYWELQDVIPFGHNVFFRLIFAWAIPSKFSIFTITQGELVKLLFKEDPIMLDLMVPASKLQSALDMCDQKLAVYPIWLCPMKLNDIPGFIHSKDSEELYVNMGIYGVPKARGFHPHNTIKEIENFVRSIKGFKMLHGGTQMTETEFRQQFDHSLYDKMRRRLNCEKAFPTIFEKINEK